LEPLKGAFSWLWDAAIHLGETVAGFIFTLAERVGKPFGRFLTSMYDRLTEALRPGSPEEELRISVETATLQFYEFVEEEIKKAYGTKLLVAALPGVATTVVAGAMTAYTTLRAAATAADCAHPAKNVGFSRIVDDMARMIGMAWLAGAPLIAMAEVGLMRPLRYYYNQMFAPWIAEPRDVVDQASSRVVPIDRYYELMRLHGYDDVVASEYLSAAWTAPTFSEAREMLWRGAITADRLREILRYQKVREDYIAGYEALIPKIPGPSDLITFVVREVITPGDFVTWMERQGFVRFWSDAYWEAHWVLPSPERVWDAFLRGVITEDEYRKYRFGTTTSPSRGPASRCLTSTSCTAPSGTCPDVSTSAGCGSGEPSTTRA